LNNAIKTITLSLKFIWTWETVTLIAFVYSTYERARRKRGPFLVMGMIRLILMKEDDIFASYLIYADHVIAVKIP
jgi:hypothetical protein